MRTIKCDFCHQEVKETPTIIKDEVEYYFYVGYRQIKSDLDDEKETDICLDCLKRLLREDDQQKAQELRNAAEKFETEDDLPF